MGQPLSPEDTRGERAAITARLRRFATREAPRLSPFYAQLAAARADSIGTACTRLGE
jgi:hypothetical protein